MLDFSFTPEQESLRAMVREWAEERVKPKVQEWDEKGVFHHEIMEDMAEMGFLGILFPESYGGAGMGYVEYVIILEELARVDPSVALTVAAHNSLCSNHIYLFGTEEQKKTYLVPLARGEVLGAWALTEPGSGSDAAGMRSIARKHKDHYILEGTKTFITHASVGKTCVVMALTKPEDHHHGISAFIVDLGSPGVVKGKKENKMGMRASDTAQLHFEGCQIPKENLLGKENEGFKQAMAVLDGGRISIAALALGVAQGAFDVAFPYAQERKQFHTPIYDFQYIQFLFADMATRIEAARWLVYKAAWKKDQHKRTTLESSMAKLYAGEIATWVTERCVQILGGYGFVKEYPAEKFYRDVKLCTIGEGTSEIQRMVIARQLKKLWEG